MINLSAKARKETGKKVKELRAKGILPAVLYGPKTETANLELDSKEFEKAYKQAGESSLINLQVGTKKYSVLIHALEIDALSRKVLHVDFYQPRLDEEISASIPLVFEGESLAVKDLGGTLVKNMHEIHVKALPQNLPHEIGVDLSKLKLLTDEILVKDLDIPKNVKVLKGLEDIVVLVSQKQEKIEEELKKPIEEKVEEVQKVEEKKKEGAEEKAAAPKAAPEKK
jgi:large subunit ribosomal protein L25